MEPINNKSDHVCPRLLDAHNRTELTIEDYYFNEHQMPELENVNDVLDYIFPEINLSTTRDR